MALQKQAFDLSFAQGVDLKTDPFRVAFGKFLRFVNSVFDKGGRLQKRNGFGIVSQSAPAASFLTTFSGNLTAIGTSIEALVAGTDTFVSKGSIQPVSLSVLPLIRNNINQNQCDTAVSENGLVCTVYTETDGSTTFYKYSVADSTTGQNVIAPTAISPTSGSVSGSPRVFVLGNYFIVVFTVTITAAGHLQYFAINFNTLAVSASADISTSYTPASTVAFDAVVANNSLYLAWNGASASGIKMTYIDSTLTQHGTTNPDASHVATIVSVCADLSGTTPVIYASYFDSGGSTGYTLAVNGQLTSVLAPTQWVNTGTLLNVTSAANRQLLTIYYEVDNAYSYDSSIKTNFIEGVTVTQAGTVGSPFRLASGVGLASKSAVIGLSIYVLAVYNSPYQPTYFLLDPNGKVIVKIAYQNGGGYLTKGLPNLQVNGTTAYVPYLFKDLIAAVNKGTALAAGTQTAGVYSQTGINVATITLTTETLSVAEIGKNLIFNGGFLWMYDGYLPVEQNFFLWPDSIEATWSATGGSIVAKPDASTNTNAYWYQVTYEWTDNQGNAFRSAPSIPVPVTTSGSGTAGSIVVKGPNLRLTYKTANPVKIVIYRWSVGQQTYFQTTSITAPLLNAVGSDSWSYTDTLADASIIGNNILYTTGGVVEDIGAPSFVAMDLFDTRVWGIDSEDQNLLWFSKQVIEATPVEMSDLFTKYVAPNAGTETATGPMRCLAPMDDKQIIFKDNAIFYINGTGPDNTGANNQYSEPIFITSTVGSSNANSLVLIPQGLMFQSNKGIWLLGRDLSTKYIGAPVEPFNSATVTSALNIPETNQVRFCLDSGITLLYDYYYDQWGWFEGIANVSSTVYQGLHTFITAPTTVYPPGGSPSYVIAGKIYQETPDEYLDGANPVLMNFQTGWLNFAGLQGYERSFYFYLLGTYLSPHKLILGIAYDYSPSILQTVTITPDNFTPVFGGGTSLSGSYPPIGSDHTFGGPSTKEQWRVFLDKQKCESFQINFQEQYDPSFGVTAGAGLTLSGLNLVVGLKKGYRPISAARSAA